MVKVAYSGVFVNPKEPISITLAESIRRGSLGVLRFFRFLLG
jgi:hypothetical protein